MRRLTVAPLSPAKIDQCFALVRLGSPHVKPELWQTYAMDYLAESRAGNAGILSVEEDRGYLLGVLVYEVGPDLHHGITMIAKDCFVYDCLERGKREIALSLIAGLEELANQQRCTSLHLRLPVSRADPVDHWLAGLLQSSGHSIVAVQYCKQLRA